MAVATHYITLDGKINGDWDEKTLRDYCDKKLEEVNDAWCAEMELLCVEGKTTKVGILIESVFPIDKHLEKETTKRIKEMAEGWVKDHIKDEGIIISKINVEALCRLGITIKNQYKNSIT